MVCIIEITFDLLLVLLQRLLVFVNVDGCFWAGRNYLTSSSVHALLCEPGVKFDRFRC